MLFTLLALAYSLVVPIGEPPDEEAHLAYVEYLLTQRRLPVQSFDPAENPVMEGHHPPLYYALVAALTGWAPHQPLHPAVNPYLPVGYDDFYLVQQYLHPVEERFPWRGPYLAAHIARLVSVALGAAGVWLTYWIGREVAPRDPRVAFLAAGMHAFLPQFVYMSGAVNNDNAAALMGSLITWYMLRLLRRPSPESPPLAGGIIGGGGLGLLLGVGVLCKASLLAMLPAALFVCSARLSARGDSNPPATHVIVAAARLIALTAALALVAGWWLWRNVQLYGDPVGWNVWMATYARFTRSLELTPRYAWTFVWTQFCSFWGRFGWGRVLLPTWLYVALAALTLLGLGGLARRLCRSWTRQDAEDTDSSVLFRVFPRPDFLLLLVVAGFLLSTWRLGLSQDTVAAQGRFFFPALSAIAVLLAVGWSAWPPRARRGLAIRLLVGGFFFLASGVLLFRLLPAHVRPLRDALPATAQPVEGEFDGLWELAGWEPSPPVVGREWTATLYWRARRELRAEERALAPTLFAHLVGADGRVIARWDGVATRGRFPPPAWSPTILAADVVRLRLPADAAPGLAYLHVGFYFGDGRRATARSTTHAVVSDALLLGPLMLRPARPPQFRPACPSDARFGAGVRLLGYDVEAEEDALRVILYWRCESPPEASGLDAARVFVHLIGADGSIAQGDGPPCGGGCPAALWRPGDVWRDEHIVPTGDLMAVGAPYTLSVGWYDAVTGERWPAFDAAGARYAEDRVTLRVFQSWPAE